MEEEDSVGNLDLESQVEKLLEIPSIDESRKYFSKVGGSGACFESRSLQNV